MTRILIGYDGSERGDDALALGQALAHAADDPEVVVASVYEALPRDVLGDPSAREERLRGEAQERLERARAAWPGAPEPSFVALAASSPGAGLQRLAADRDADVIVVGASHRSALGRIWPGSVTEQTLLGAPRPVAVAPPGYAAAHPRPAPFARIGLGYDGSPEARHALAWTAPLAAATDATVVVLDAVHAEGLTLTAAYGYSTLVESMREAADLQLHDARAALHAAGVARVETERLEGPPSHELVAASKRLDLLVLGSRGHGPALRLLLGSSSTRVVRDAACPVLVLPRSAAPDEAEREPGARDEGGAEPSPAARGAQAEGGAGAAAPDPVDAAA